MLGCIHFSIDLSPLDLEKDALFRSEGKRASFCHWTDYWIMLYSFVSRVVCFMCVFNNSSLN